MKQKDIVVIIAVVGVSAVVAIIASKMLIKPADKQQQVEVVQAISTDFPTPDTRYFNANAINPTLSIQIGDNTNTDPFKGTQQ